MARTPTYQDLEKRIKLLEDESIKRKQAEEALQIANSYNRSLIESSLDPLVTIGLDGKITDVNQASEAATGYGRDEIIGTDFADYFTEPELARAGYRKVFQDGQVRDYALNLRHRDGGAIPVLYNAAVYRNARGEVVGVFAAAREISRRQQAEKKSRDMLNFLQALFNTIPSPIFCKDIKGLYVDCNREFEDYVGLKRKDIIGKGVYDMYAKEVADKYHEMDVELFRNPGRQIYEYQIMYADGNIHDVLVNKATYLNAEGGVAGLVGVMVDITERKRAEEQLEIYHQHLEELVKKRTRELEEKNIALSELNITLKVLLQQRNSEKKDLENIFVSNIQTIIFPYIEKMKTGVSEGHQRAWLTVIEKSLGEIISPLLQTFRQFNFTHQEIQIATLIREGKTTKEIAELMGIAKSSTDAYRNRIRKKLGISNIKTNLYAYLQSIS